MESGKIIDIINRTTIFDLDEEETEDRYWHRFNQFTGYRAYIVLKNMAIYEKSVGTFLIMFNHLV